MTASDTPVAVVEGPKGRAEIFEIYGPGQPLIYQLKIGDEVIEYKSLGEAYIDAGERVGTKT